MYVLKKLKVKCDTHPIDLFICCYFLWLQINECDFFHVYFESIIFFCTTFVIGIDSMLL